MLSVLFVALFALIVGLAFCFAGYRVFLVMLPIWGFFAGFWLGAEVITLLFGTGFLATTTGWVVGFVAGLFGAVLSYLFYMVGVGLLAAAFGWALGAGIMAALGLEPGLLTATVGVISALVMAALVLFLNIQKYVIMLITAIGGANAIVLAGLLLLGRVTLEELSGAGSAIAPILQDSWFWLNIWLVLAIAGFILQILINRTYVFDRNQYQEGWG